MKRNLLLFSCLLALNFLASSQATHPYQNCPDVNIAIVRAGTNADVTNPYFLYNVTPSTGIMSLVAGGPYKDPLNPTVNLQVNGIGVSKKDGYIYGMATTGFSPSVRFVRLDNNYGVTDLGVIPSPAGILGFVNPAAGEMDTAGNYYFSAFSLNAAFPPTFNKFYIGKISNTQNLVSGPPTVQYFEVDISSAPCTAYISTFMSDPSNSGLKDFSYNAKTNSFYSYATYKLPGASTFSGQLLSLTPVAGSSPLRYQLNCNPTVNTHTAETSGTAISKTGLFTVLFTDGSYGMLDTTSAGVYTGAYHTINAATGLPNPLRADMGSCGQATAQYVPPMVFECPKNYAVARAGFNADINNPYSIYTVNGVTGALTLLPGGPLYYPGTTKTLQVNGIGVNEEDGLIYGMAFEGLLQTARLVKFDANYNVTLLGNIPPPTSGTGTIGFVNSAAGEVDREDNYWFTAVTAKAGTGAGGLQIDKLWLGKIEHVSTVTGTPSPVYYEVDWAGNPCADLISSFTADPVNSGIKDLFYHPVTRSFFTYVTYKLPGDAQYRGQLVELQPIGNPASPSKYRMFCKNVINMHTAETSGTMVTEEGNFLVLMTDGTIGTIPRTGNSYNYSGNYVALNTNTGLPPVIRGDLGSCTSLHHPSEKGNEEEKTSASAMFSLHPNPLESGRDLTIKWNGVPAEQKVSIVLYNSSSVILKTVANVKVSQDGQYTMNTGNLAPGTYYVRIISADGSTDQRLTLIRIN